MRNSRMSVLLNTREHNSQNFLKQEKERRWKVDKVKMKRSTADMKKISPNGLTTVFRGTRLPKAVA